MYNKYYSLAQSFSTQYLLAQVKQMKHQNIKRKAFKAVLKSRLLTETTVNNNKEYSKH